MTIQGPVFFDLLGNRGRIFFYTFSNLPQGGTGIQTFLDRYPVVLRHVFVVSGYRL